MKDYYSEEIEKKDYYAEEIEAKAPSPPTRKLSLLEELRRRLPYQKQIAGGLRAYEEKGGEFLRERILPDVPAVAKGFLEMPKHLHPLAQLLELGKTGREVIGDVAKGKPLGETYLGMAERPFGVGLAVRTARRPRETWVEHPLPSGIEALMTLLPFVFKGARMGKPKITPKEITPKIKPVAEKPALGQPEMEMAKELKRRGVTEKPAEIPTGITLSEAELKTLANEMLNDAKIISPPVVSKLKPAFGGVRVVYDPASTPPWYPNVGLNKTDTMAGLKNIVKEGYKAKNKNAQQLFKKIQDWSKDKARYEPTKAEIVGGDLVKGDKVKINGEWYTAKPEPKTGMIELIDEQNIKLDIFEKLPVQELVKAKPTGEIKPPGIMGGVEAKGQEASVQSWMH